MGCVVLLVCFPVGALVFLLLMEGFLFDICADYSYRQEVENEDVSGSTS